MATSAMAVVGEHERDWADFGVADLFFAHKPYSGAVRGFGVVFGPVHGLWVKSRIGLGQTKITPQPLIVLLELAHRAQAKDPRDRVYSLLGLAEEEPEFKADYKKAANDPPSIVLSCNTQSSIVFNFAHARNLLRPWHRSRYRP
jgi:hypothetical protein